MSWWQARLEVPAEMSEAVAYLLAEQLEVAVEVQDEGTLDKGVDADTHRVLIGMATPPDDTFATNVALALEPLGLAHLTVAVVQRDDDDWRERWKAFFHRLQLSPRVWVRPPWEDAAPAPAVTVIIDPGMAFGTGQHATTRAVTALLDEVLADLPPQRVLDVGAGSGILAIAAALLGHTAVAVENDPEAADNATENIGHNGVGDRVTFITGTAAEVPGTFSIVVANIISPVLIAIADELRDRAADHLLLSGMLHHQVEDVRACYPDFDEVLRREDGEWSVMHLRRRAAP